VHRQTPSPVDLYQNSAETTGPPAIVSPLPTAAVQQLTKNVEQFAPEQLDIINKTHGRGRHLLATDPRRAQRHVLRSNRLYSDKPWAAAAVRPRAIRT